MNVLFFDGDKDRQQAIKKKIPGCKIASTYHQCVETIQKEEVWNILFLGYDYVSFNGATLLDWLRENEPQIRNVVVHHHDGVLGTQTCKELTKLQYTATYLPYKIMIENMEKING